MLIYDKAALWINRVAFTVVFVLNVSCAIAFIIHPEVHASAYELFGPAGSVAVQGLGVVFLMWNVTYPLYVYNPGKYRALGVIIVIQQLIGLAGELYILFMLGAGHDTLMASILKFIAFDAGGLVVELAALITLFMSRRRTSAA